MQKGPNKTPVAAICLTSLITLAFVFIGQVNVLAPIVTINFMLTYIAVDYSYFSVSMSYNLKQNSKRMRQEDARAVLSCSRPLMLSKSICYGSNGRDQCRSDGTLLEFTKDMNHLFKPVSQDPGTDLELKENNVDAAQVIKQRKQKKAAKQTLEDSFCLALENNIAHIQEPCNDSRRSSVKNVQHFSQPNCQDGDGNDASPSVIRKNNQKEDGDQHLDEMRKASSPQMEGKKIWSALNYCVFENEECSFAFLSKGSDHLYVFGLLSLVTNCGFCFCFLQLSTETVLI